MLCPASQKNKCMCVNAGVGLLKLSVQTDLMDMAALTGVIHCPIPIIGKMNYFNVFST